MVNRGLTSRPIAIDTVGVWGSTPQVDPTCRTKALVATVGKTEHSPVGVKGACKIVHSGELNLFASKCLVVLVSCELPSPEAVLWRG
jgi:hypothetical protein